MMLFLRSLVANLYFYPAMALGFVVSLPVGVFSRLAMVAMWDKFLHPVIWSGMLKLCGITIEVRGKEYITPGVIFASKHESAFETYAYTDIIPHSVFVLKKELTYIPLGAGALRHDSGGPRRRSQSDEGNAGGSEKTGGSRAVHHYLSGRHALQTRAGQGL